MKIFKKKKKESEFFLAIKTLIDEANPKPNSSMKVVHLKSLNSK